MLRVLTLFVMVIAILAAVPTGGTVTAAVTAGAGQAADEGSVDAALDYIRNGDTERGEIILQRLAGKGSGEALFHMGELFRLGIGRDKANGVATMYYRLSSALGHKRSSLSLANLLFFEGDGSEKTIGEALGLWQTLALEGNVESIYMLGMIYWNGEAGLSQDPVRGYGLVWRASEAGYSDAIQNELTMRSLLNAEARQAARDYGNSFDVDGFGTQPLALDLVTATADTEDVVVADASAADAAKALPEPEKEPEAPLVKPDDWSTVWRLEVGFAMSEVEVRRLQSMISQTQGKAVGKLFNDISPSVSRPGLFRLVYGPLKGMHQAVNTCVSLKRAGYECSAQAPE